MAQPKLSLHARKRLRLTPEAIALVEAGCSHSEIADALGVSRATVINWLDRVGAAHPRRKRVAYGTTNQERLALGTGNQDPETGCIPWTRGTDVYGYGRVTPADERPSVGAHRLTLEVRLDRRLAADEIARHACDTPICVNPDHVILGSHGDNARDMIARGRGKMQKRHASPEQVALRAKAFTLLEAGWSQSAVAREVGVNPSTVSSWVARYK